MKMQARKAAPGKRTKTTGGPSTTPRKAGRTAAPPGASTDAQEALFDEMLAEMDRRIEEVARKTDRLLAKGS